MRGKKIGGTRSSVEASVLIKVGDIKVESKSIKSLDPFWDEDLSIPVEDTNEFIEISLIHSGLVGRSTLGRVRLTIIEVAAAGEKGIVNCPYDILNEDLEFDGVNRGVLFLEMKWVYDEITAKFLAEEKLKGPGIFSGLMNLLFKKKDKASESSTEKDQATASKAVLDKDTEEEEEEVAEKYAGSNLSPYELSVFLEEQKQRRLKEIDDFLENSDSQVDLKDGDYTVQVHIIECQNLRSKDANGEI